MVTVGSRTAASAPPPSPQASDSPTSLTPDQATGAQIATYLRGHWGIENALHWVRDVTYREDHCQTRTHNGPHTMTTLRNLAITTLRLTGHNNIAKATRYHQRNPTRPLHTITLC